MNKLKNVINKMTTTDWVQVILWFVSLILLFAFVAVAAAFKADAGKTFKASNANAIVALLFALSLCASILVTVFVKFFEKKKGGK